MTNTVSVGSARERLLAAAARLFYANGMAATGIDSITAQAGVAKMSLYNNFASKDDLMLAYINARHEEWLALYRARAETASAPRELVLAVFDAYIDHVSVESAPEFRGCGLLNAAGELPAGSPGRDAVRRHKEQVEAILSEHLQLMTESVRAQATAEHFAFLVEGAMVRAGLEGTADRLHHARRIAAAVIDAL